MNIKEEYEDKIKKLKSELQDAEDQELELEISVYDLEKELNDHCGSQISDFAEEIDDELDVTVVFDEDTQYL
ncbi:hypothetical protein C1646_755533 [Rhizophagus diaphanus]|nr:hypothetical protein C1646_755533 [Rhizophagus diaphanus] [Rhizophagus sp. MUCL 43196]